MTEPKVVHEWEDEKFVYRIGQRGIKWYRRGDSDSDGLVGTSEWGTADIHEEICVEICRLAARVEELEEKLVAGYEEYDLRPCAKCGKRYLEVSVLSRCTCGDCVRAENERLREALEETVKYLRYVEMRAMDRVAPQPESVRLAIVRCRAALKEKP